MLNPGPRTRVFLAMGNRDDAIEEATRAAGLLGPHHRFTFSARTALADALAEHIISSLDNLSEAAQAAE